MQYIRYIPLYSFSNLIFSFASAESVVETTVVDSALGDTDDVFDGRNDVAVVDDSVDGSDDPFDSAEDTFGMTRVDEIGVVVDTADTVEVLFDNICAGVVDTTDVIDSVDGSEESFTGVADV